MREKRIWHGCWKELLAKLHPDLFKSLEILNTHQTKILLSNFARVMLKICLRLIFIWFQNERTNSFQIKYFTIHWDMSMPYFSISALLTCSLLTLKPYFLILWLRFFNYLQESLESLNMILTSIFRKSLKLVRESRINKQLETS